MQWPIRNQVLFPMVGVLSGVILCLSLVSARLASNWIRGEMDAQAESLQRTLSESRFPLTDSVLEQMAGLSRAQYVLVDDSGDVIAASGPDFAHIDSQEWLRLERARHPGMRSVTLGGRSFYHRFFPIDRRKAGGELTRLHVLFPAETYVAAWRRAVYPPLAVGAVALVIVVFLSLWTARRVTAPLARLREHAARLSSGDFGLLEVPRRRDEIAELVEAVNRMAELLARYEQDVREAERMETLTHLGSSMAHQIRNAATGCRLAIDLHRQSLAPDQRDTEDLRLARDQLKRIESYLERFLQLGRGVQERSGDAWSAERTLFLAESDARSKASDVMDAAVRQVQPMATHLGVELEVASNGADVSVGVQAEALEQALVNMLRNGIEAAAERVHSHCMAMGGGEGDGGGSPESAWVRLECVAAEAAAEFQVWDNGAGPSPDIAARLYQPFTSDKRGGAGLGLALVAWVARSAGGSVDWSRHGERTRFRLRLPIEQEKP